MGFNPDKKLTVAQSIMGQEEWIDFLAGRLDEYVSAIEAKEKGIPQLILQEVSEFLFAQLGKNNKEVFLEFERACRILMNRDFPFPYEYAIADALRLHDGGRQVASTRPQVQLVLKMAS